MGQKNCWVHEILIQKTVISKNILGPKNSILNNKGLRSKKKLVQKSKVQKKFGQDKVLGPENDGSKNSDKV